MLTLLGNENATEGPDLEYKAGPVPYKTGTEGAGEFVKDVLALANSGGGVLVLGVAENRKTSVPSAVVPVPTTDHARKHYRTILVQRAAPHVECAIHFITEKPGDTEGVTLIAVPPSASAPHAVVGTADPHDGTLRFPVRNDNTTHYMSLAQVKNTIMATNTTTAARRQFLAQVEKDALGAAWLGYPITVVTLVPDLPGAFTISKSSLEAFRRDPGADMFWHSPEVFRHTSVGPRRITASDAPSRGRHAVHLHADGSGSWGSKAAIRQYFPNDDDETEGLVAGWDSHHIVKTVLDQLRYLLQHATERAGAAGTATLQITLHAAEELHLGTTTHSRSNVTIGTSAHGRASGTAGVLLDSSPEGGPELVRGIAAALADLYQHYGVVESDLLTLDGEIVLNQWVPNDQQRAEAWAANAGVTVVR
ncbi:helix-turn-helix domain-containing protein [Kitasatospora sp. NPDC101801]|uniref:AlbA family DNA-binding domain-containing protein n=1 Tax=Kitasatospora sp. NPDC101801 TaxID=3364103 RepID=UPI00382974A9